MIDEIDEIDEFFLESLSFTGQRLGASTLVTVDTKSNSPSCTEQSKEEQG
jgi:hypothetical protein